MKPTPDLPKGFDNVYDPSEDSFFLIDCLEKDETFLQDFAKTSKSPLLIAELGTGTGIVSSFVPHVLSHKYIALASDVNPAACECAKRAWDLNWSKEKVERPTLETVRGNLLDWIRPNLVDVLLFNPPYVPSPSIPQLPSTHGEKEDYKDDKWVDLALDGGADGMEITNIVLEELGTKLSPQGIAYILFCASNRPQKVCEYMVTRGWAAEHIDTRRAGWEILSVYRFHRK